MRAAANTWFLAALACAGTALGQTQVTDQVRLELRLVSQLGTPSNPATQVRSFDGNVHVDTASGLGVVRRFEMQYRLVDLNTADAFVPAGLTSCNLRIVAHGGTLERAILSNYEARHPSRATPYPNDPVNLDTDTGIISGNSAIGPFRGLHAPYRAAVPAPLPSNSSNANGVFGAGNTELRNITPLALAQTDQNEGGWYGLYSFNFVPADRIGSVEISCDVDVASGNRFGFFNHQEPVPVVSPIATSDVVRIVLPGTIGGACCSMGAMCAMLTASECSDIQGEYRGDGTSCTPNYCPPPYACCLPGFNCIVAPSAASCSGAGGSPLLHSTCEAQACCPFPMISDQPDGLMYLLSQPANIHVTAAHPGALTYRWRRNGSSLTESAVYTGVTTNTLHIPSATRSVAGVYDVMVTSACGNETISNSAEITICVADYDASGTLDLNDVLTLLADYFSGNLTADFNDSGVLSVQDIFDFLAAYFAGCA